MCIRDSANKITANQNSTSDALLPTKRRLVKASIPDTKLAPPSPLPTEKNLLPTTNDTTSLLPPAPPSFPLLPTLPSIHLPSQTVIAPPNRVHTIHQKTLKKVANSASSKHVVGIIKKQKGEGFLISALISAAVPLITSLLSKSMKKK